MSLLLQALQKAAKNRESGTAPLEEHAAWRRCLVQSTPHVFREGDGKPRRSPFQSSAEAWTRVDRNHNGRIDADEWVWWPM